MMRKILLMLGLLLPTIVLAENNAANLNWSPENVSTKAAVQPDPIKTVNYQDENRGYVYVGFDLGYVNNHYNNWWQKYESDVFAPTTTESDGFAGRIKMGVKFNQYFALELGLLISPKVKFNNISFNGSGNGPDETFRQNILDTSVKLSLPLKDKIQLFAQTGLGGVFRYDLKATYHGHTNVDDTDIAAQTTFILGGGVNYDISRHFLLDLLYLHYFASSDFPGTDFLAAGLAYKF
ncbi:MAG: porin family protein [Gammaproteobacteria bacterium]|nr:porin family protein [Gammaproteobacteria bacterium]